MRRTWASTNGWAAAMTARSSESSDPPVLGTTPPPSRGRRGPGTGGTISSVKRNNTTTTISPRSPHMNTSISTHRPLFVGLAAMLLLAGCGGADGPELASVSGTVTLNGQPLPHAVVQFQPTSPQG